MLKDKTTDPVIEEAADWVLFTQTHGGKVSLIKGLTKGEARQAARRAAPLHLRPDRPRQMRLDTHEGLIRNIQIFRGTGETADIFGED